MFAEVLHSAMHCLPVIPHENTEFLVNPGPTRIQIWHMTQYDIVKYSTVHIDIAQYRILYRPIYWPSQHYCDIYQVNNVYEYTIDDY